MSIHLRREALLIAIVCFWIALVLGQAPQYNSQLMHRSLTTTTNGTGLFINSVPFSTREYWMRQANLALYQLSGPCPFAAFGSVVVNHTGQTGVGKVVCIGANNRTGGNPINHGNNDWSKLELQLTEKRGNRCYHKL